MFKINTKNIILLICLIFSGLQALPPINLFRPTDRPMLQEFWPCNRFQFTVGYETAFHVNGFQEDNDDCNQVGSSCDVDKKVNPLQIYGNEQNGLEALKGFDSYTPLGQLAQLFNINDENGKQARLIPCGDFKVPLNLMFTARYQFCPGVNFGLYLPYYIMELKDVRWKIKNDTSTLEGNLENDLLGSISKLSNLDICGWRRAGLGDLTAMGIWMRDFPQAKPLLKNVRLNARFGLDFPTGVKENENKLLAIPFGNDGAWALRFAGGIDLSFWRFLRGGLDAEFVYIFGNTRCRRVKSDCNQTDLLFLNKIPAFREFGLSQQFNVYIETLNFCSGLTFKINYQYLKRNEDKLFVKNDRLDPIIVNSAENLQDWTAHSLIFMAGYDYGYECPNSKFTPAINAWVKWGFNGKRAILANTVGLTATVAF